jgi:predicted nucleotidyltransferase component of viral defense system
MQSIPETAAPFFQEYNFSALDVQIHASLIIERILAYGNRAEVRWLFDVYGIEALRAWVRQDGERRLPQRRYELWRTLLDIPVRRITERRQAWPY